jgi:predicted transcriptional regulator of viral defense system
MQSATRHKLEEIALGNQGAITLLNARNAGIQASTIYKLRDAGELVCISRGVYQLADAGDLSSASPEYLAIRSRIPHGVLCTISALYHYELTTEIPNCVHLGIRRNNAVPRMDYPPVEIYRMPEAVFSHGVQSLTINGVEMNIFTPEKTLADCFKYRNRLGVDVVIDGLKRYLQKSNAQPSVVLAMAKINRVAAAMKPYIEALV